MGYLVVGLVVTASLALLGARLLREFREEGEN